MFPLILEILRNLFTHQKNLHLVILQNNNEIRATGGFITQILVLETSFLRCKLYFKNIYTDITTTVPRACPEAMQKMLFDHHTSTLQFRDANFHPDFRESALLLADLYNDTCPNSIITTLTAVNSAFIEVLLHLVGGVSIEGKTVTEKNFFSFLSGDVSDIDRHSKEALAERKSILKKLFVLLCKKILIHFYLLPAVWREAQDALASKNIQYYLYSSHTASSSVTLPEHADCLSLIEDNYLGLKSNRYIQRTLFHDTFIDKGGVFHNTLNIEWRHHGVDSYPLSGAYRGYVRIYLPKDILLDTCTEVDEVEITKSEDATILGFSLFLDPSENFNFEIHYTLSPLQKEKYNFHYIKQSGITDEVLIKSLACAPNYELSSTTDTYNIKDALYFTHTQKVHSDISWSFLIAASMRKPRVISHEIIQEDTAVIEFNEEVSLQDSRIEVFSKEDLHAIPLKEYFLDTSKKVLVLKAPFKKEEEKFYTIQLEGIKNTNGIFIAPNPRQVTVVYRSRYFR